MFMTLLYPDASARMIVNQEIMNVLAAHYAVPAQPDGACLCGVAIPDGQIAHLIEVLQSKQGGNMPTFTQEPDVDTTEDLVGPLVTVRVPVNERAELTAYDLRLEALDAALRMQENVDDYTNVEALLDEAELIYAWLLEGVED